MKEARTLLVMKSMAPATRDIASVPGVSKRTRELSGSSGEDNSNKRQKFLERNRYVQTLHMTYRILAEFIEYKIDMFCIIHFYLV